MKQLFFILIFLISTVANAQFTIRSLSGLTSSNFANSDLMLISLASPLGTLRNLTYSNFRQNLEDETWDWSTTHDFNGTTSITGGTFYIQNIKTASTAGELANTTSHNYLKYKGANEDTLATWRHIWQDDITAYGTRTFRNTFSVLGSGNIAFSSTGTFLVGSSAFDITAPTDFTDELVTFNDSIDFLAGSKVILNGDMTINGGVVYGANGTLNMSSADRFAPPDISGETSFPNLGYDGGSSGSAFLLFNYGAVVFTDSMLSDRALRADDHILSGDITFNADVIHKPQETSLAGGSSALAITKSFLVLDGDGGTPSSISDFTGLKSEGQKITVMCLRADGDGFTILDNVNIECAGGANITMSSGDIAEFIYMDGKWASTSPLANNN